MRNFDTNQDYDDEFKEFHRPGMAGRITDDKEDQDITRGEKYPSPQWQRRNEQAKPDGGTEKLCQVRADDCNLAQDIERIKNAEPVEVTVFRPIVEEHPTVGSKIYRQRLVFRAVNTNVKTNLPRPVTQPSLPARDLD